MIWTLPTGQNGKGGEAFAMRLVGISFGLVVALTILMNIHQGFNRMNVHIIVAVDV